MKIYNALRFGAIASLGAHQVYAFGGIEQPEIVRCEAETLLTDLIAAGGPKDLVKQTGVVYKTGSEESKFTVALDPMTEDSVLTPVWSASKMVSSILINKLAEEGALDLDKPVHEYIGWWTKDSKDPRSKVTLRHLLSMTAGFGSDILGEKGEASCEMSMLSQEECAKSLFEDWYGQVQNGMEAGWGHEGVAVEDVEPGKYFLYGEASWVIALFIAEAVSGKVWPDLFREHIGTPLGLDDGCNYKSFFGKGAVIDGGAMLSCSAKDYEKILMAYFNEELVSAKTMVDMESAFTHTIGAKLPPGNAYINPVDSKILNYGLGFWVSCTQENCQGSDNFVQSVGADGVIPYIDRRDSENEFWGLVFRNQGDLTGMETSMKALSDVAAISAEINKC